MAGAGVSAENLPADYAQFPASFPPSRAPGDMRDRYSVRVKTHSSGCHCGPSVCCVRRGCLPLSVVLRFCKPQSRCGALWPGSLCRSLSVHTFKFQPYFPFPAAGLSPQLASTWNSGQPVAAAAAREPPPVRSTVPRDGLCSQAASREARASTGGPARVLPRRTGELSCGRLGTCPSSPFDSAAGEAAVLPLARQMLPRVCPPSRHQTALVVWAQRRERANWSELMVIHPRTVILGLTFDC